MAPHLSPDQEGALIAERAPSRMVALRAVLPLALILALALALRLWGITWALPSQDRYYTYHPDEGVNLIQGVLDDTGTPRPHLDLRFYNYGGLYFYLWQGAVAINRAYGIIALPQTGQPEVVVPDSLAAIILVGRLLTVFFGTLTAWAVFAVGNRLFGRNAGLLAALVWAVCPVAVMHGHYATVDVTATFFVMLTLAVAAKALPRVDPREPAEAASAEGSLDMRPLLWSGLIAGLAGATKYNCVLVLFAPLAATHILRSHGRIPKWLIPAIVGVAALGFLLGCPGVLVHPSRFWADFTFELAKSREGMGLLFAQTGNGWWYHLASSLRFGMGVPLLLISLAGLVLAFARRKPGDLLLLAFLVPYYLVIGFAQVRFLRYILPIMPVLAVFSARALIDSSPPIGLRRAAGAVGAAVLAFTLLLTLALDRMFVRPDTRDVAKSYIEALPRGASVAFVTLPWYQAPPLSPGFTLPSPRARREAALQYAGKRLLIPAPNVEWDKAVLGPPLPDALAVSEIETEDAVRLDLAAARPFLKAWRERYTAHNFDKTPSVFGFDFGKPAYTPNDWLYPNPRTTVYTLDPPPVILSHEPTDRGLHKPPVR